MPIHYADCEGPCCCRCSACSTVGYFDKYTATIPKQTQVASSACDITLAFITNAQTPITVTLNGFETSEGSMAWNGLGGGLAGVNVTYPTYSTEAVYGSAGGTGKCVWSYFNVTQHPIYLEWVMTYIRYFRPAGFTTGMRLQYDIWLFALGCGLRKLTSYFDYDDATCINPGGANFVHTGDDLENTVGWTPVWDGNATVDLFGGATWYQCGKNSDGTDVTVESFGMAAPASAPVASKSSASSRIAMTISNPDRCQYRGKRIKISAGCSGWGSACTWECKSADPDVSDHLGGVMETVLSDDCQSCPGYSLRVESAGKGIAGWLEQ